MFEPALVEQNMFTVALGNVHQSSIQTLAEQFEGKGWHVLSKSWLGIHSIQELVGLIDANPLHPKDAKLLSSLTPFQLCPLMWTSHTRDALLIAVRLQENSFTRDAERIHTTLTELLGFTFGPQKPQERVQLLILPAEEYDQIAKHDLLTHPEARRVFRHQYTETAVGAEIRDSITAKTVKGCASDVHIQPFQKELESPPSPLYRVLVFFESWMYML